MTLTISGRDFGKDVMYRKWKNTAYGAVCEAAGIFYPPRCPVCDEILQPGMPVCVSCRDKIKLAAEPVCKRCGKPLGDGRREYCGDCLKKKHVFCQGKAVFLYQGELRQSMYRFKYAGRREYASFYAAAAGELYADWVKRNRIEVIVPVPMYSGKKRRRGYNQAEVFAKALGRELGLAVDRKLVKRVRDTIPQKELNDVERRHNLKNAFQLGTDIVKYNQVLLVDDIYTTGSTMDAVAEVLLTAGVKGIYFICVSIGAGY